MAELADYDALSASNSGAPPEGAPEGMTRSDVNNVMREMMGAMRRDWEGTATGGGSWRDPVKTYTVTFSTTTKVLIAGVDATAFFPVGRKVQIAATAGPAYAFVKTSTYSNPDTTIEVESFDSPATAVPATTNGLLFYAAFGGTNALGRSAFGTSIASELFVVPSTRDTSGINAAIASAASKNAVVLLEAAAYALEGTIIPTTNTYIMGLGRQTILKLDNAKNANCITIPPSTNGVVLRDFTIDGNAANQSTAGNGVNIVGLNQNCRLQNVEIVDTFDAGVSSSLGGTIGLHIEGVTVRRPGKGGIRLVDPVGTSEDTFISDIEIEDVGNAAGAGDVSADGLFLEGEFTAQNIQVEMNLPNGHVGAAIQLELVDTGAAPSRGGSYSSLSNFRIIGTGRDVTGLKIGGSRNSIGPGVVEFSGASALPIHIQGRDATDPADHNLITGVNFIGGLRCECGTFSHKTTFSGCRFDGQTGHGLRFAAPDCRVKSSSFQGTQDGIEVLSAAVDSSISGCSFEGVVATGVIALAHRLSVTASDFRGGVEAISVRSGVDQCSIAGSFFYKQTGTRSVHFDSGDENSVVGCNFVDCPTNSSVQIVGGVSANRNACVVTLFHGSGAAPISDAGTATVTTGSVVIP